MKIEKIIFFVFFFFTLQTVSAQVGLETEIDNSAPTLSFFETYSRYGNASDNFLSENFTICVGEDNRTVYFRFVAEDKNSNLEISNGNVSWKIVSVVNGTDTNVSSFENFRQASFESTLSGTEISYLENLTLSDENKTVYKIITNITDSNGAFVINESFFTLEKTECIRVEENASIVTTQPYQLVTSYVNLSIVVEENVTGRIIVTLHNESPVDSNVDEALDKYITIDVEGVILQEAINLSLFVNYTQEEISEKGLDESSLRIYKWGSWNLQEGGVDTSNNIVNFVINESLIANQSYRLGTYSVRGDLLSSGTTGGSSGGGGGSGGGSGSSGTGSPVTGRSIGEPNLGPGDGTRTALFDLEVSVINHEVDDGELFASISLINIGSPGEVEANLHYSILNEKGEVVYREIEAVSLETQTEFIKRFDVSELPGESYDLVVDLTYEGQEQPVNVGDNFSVIYGRQKSLNFSKIFCWMLVLIIFILLILLYRERKKRRELGWYAGLRGYAVPEKESDSESFSATG